MVQSQRLGFTVIFIGLASIIPIFIFTTQLSLTKEQLSSTQKKRDEITHLALNLKTFTAFNQQEIDKEHFTFIPYSNPPLYHFDVQFLANSSYFMTRRLVDKNNKINGNDTSVVENSLLVHGKEERAECMDVERIVCDAGNINTALLKLLPHLPHFAQLVFPCYAILQRFPPYVEKYIQLHKGVPRGKGEWKSDLVSALENSGIKFIEHDDAYNETKCQWNVAIPKIQSPFPAGPNFERGENETIVLHPNHDDHKWKRTLSDYFASHSDMVSLQQSVLGSEFIPGVSKDLRINVLVLNRSGTRRLTYGKEIAKEIANSIFDKRGYIEVTYLNDMSEREGLHAQALTIHSADIIISPHGAQLTNLAFMKPCTVVAEIYPRGYFLDFFQPYVIKGHGISYQGYENERIPLIDNIGLDTYEKRAKRREKPILISTESIINVLPDFLIQFQACRNNS